MALFRRRRTYRTRRADKRSLMRQFIYGGIAITIVVLIGYGVWYVTRLPFFTLSEVTVSGGETITHEEIKDTVEKALIGSYLFLIPKRFTYTYPKEAIATAIAAIPRVRSVSVEKTNRNTLVVTFTEYSPYALWCAADDETNCVFLSAEGYAFAKAPPLRGGAFVRHTVEGRSPEAGVQLFSRDDMVRIEALIGGFEKELRLRVHEIVHTANGDEVYRLSGGGDLLVAPQQSAQTTFDNLRSILESEQFKHLEPGNFSYIDLRFGNRVFVNEETGATDEASPKDNASTTDETATTTGQSLPETH